MKSPRPVMKSPRPERKIPRSDLWRLVVIVSLFVMWQVSQIGFGRAGRKDSISVPFSYEKLIITETDTDIDIDIDSDSDAYHSLEADHQSKVISSEQHYVTFSEMIKFGRLGHIIKAQLSALVFTELYNMTYIQCCTVGNKRYDKKSNFFKYFDFGTDNEAYDMQYKHCYDNSEKYYRVDGNQYGSWKGVTNKSQVDLLHKRYSSMVEKLHLRKCLHLQDEFRIHLSTVFAWQDKHLVPAKTVSNIVDRLIVAFMNLHQKNKGDLKNFLSTWRYGHLQKYKKKKVKVQRFEIALHVRRGDIVDRSRNLDVEHYVNSLKLVVESMGSCKRFFQRIAIKVLTEEDGSEDVADLCKVALEHIQVEFPIWSNRTDCRIYTDSNLHADMIRMLNANAFVMSNSGLSVIIAWLRYREYDQLARSKTPYVSIYPQHTKHFIKDSRSLSSSNIIKINRLQDGIDNIGGKQSKLLRRKICIRNITTAAS